MELAASVQQTAAAGTPTCTSYTQSSNLCLGCTPAGNVLIGFTDPSGACLYQVHFAYVKVLHVQCQIFRKNPVFDQPAACAILFGVGNDAHAAGTVAEVKVHAH